MHGPWICRMRDGAGCLAPTGPGSSVPPHEDEDRQLQRERHNGRLPVLLRWLRESEPDIVCLQELKAPHEKFPITAIEGAGYQAIWHGRKSWNGVAILSRVPQDSRQRVCLGHGLGEEVLPAGSGQGG